RRVSSVSNPVGFTAPPFFTCARSPLWTGTDGKATRRAGLPIRGCHLLRRVHIRRRYSDRLHFRRPHAHGQSATLACPWGRAWLAPLALGCGSSAPGLGLLFLPGPPPRPLRHLLGREFRGRLRGTVPLWHRHRGCLLQERQAPYTGALDQRHGP